MNFAANSWTQPLAGHVAIVTGGAGNGIGQGISRQLAKAGAQVVIADVDEAGADAVAANIRQEGGHAFPVRADVSDALSVERLVETVRQRFGKIDVLVNSAGIGLVKPLHEASEAEFDRLMSVDLRGVWLCCKAVIPAMQALGRGSIVNISSIHHQASLKGYAIYAAAKAGVNALARGIAIQYGQDGIRANAICPGLVDGSQTRALVASFAPQVDAWLQSFVRQNQCLPELIQPEDIGNAVVFLASPLSRCVTGATLTVDGGTLVRMAAS